MSSATARDEHPSGAEVSADVHTGGDAAENHPDSGANACRITRVGRLYVAFAEGMTLEDFEIAAAQAKRMLAFVEREICARTPFVDASGRLAAALHRGPLELFELHFTRADASAAEVSLRAMPDQGVAGPVGAFRVLVTEQDGRMQASSVDVHRGR